MGICAEEYMLHAIHFAECQTVFRQDYEEYMTPKLIEEYESWEVDVNIQKTQYICVEDIQKN